MSTWREIWKDSLKANRIMSADEQEGLAEFDKLYKFYGDDGMIHYAVAAAWEYRGNYAKSVEEYSLAEKLFPAKHWKDVAHASLERVSSHKSTEAYYDADSFESLIWYSFQKVYEFVNLDDIVRYVCLSALARADSEWPLSLVDFRTVLELQIKTVFPGIVKDASNNERGFSLFEAINELEKQGYISSEIKSAMHKIRIAGNVATHEFCFDPVQDIPNIKNLLRILKFFNEIK